jgi:hypothetical protein
LNNLTIYPEDKRNLKPHNEAGLAHFEQYLETTILPFSSARAAMIFPLKQLRQQRTAEILIPQYLSQCVTSALGKAVLPALRPSTTTKAILVYHQYGYPQRTDLIEKEANANNWIIVNNCVNGLFAQIDGESLLNWGDYSVFSFPKFYHCTMGGGLCLNNSGLFSEDAQRIYEDQFLSQQDIAQQAFSQLTHSKTLEGDFEKYCMIEAVYGYLPELITMPRQATALLPPNIVELQQDIARRRKILCTLSEALPGRMPDVGPNEWLVPFAIPISGEPDALSRCSKKIKDTLSIDAPVLNFDYARNMLAPEFKPALVVGTHVGWDDIVIQQVLEIVHEY